jgi:Cu+-exporting ATPase
MALESGTLVTLDPVCGMEVNELDPGATYEYKKKTYSFCSSECMERFAANPEGYTGF